MSTVDSGIENQQIINVKPEEMEFFREFTRKHKIKWELDQQENNILVLSASLVGFINTPYRQITLSPKYSELTFQHVLRLYLYVYSYNQNSSSQLLDVSNANTSFELAQQFMNYLEDNINRGINRNYKITNVSEKALIGRVNINKTLLNLRQHKKLPVITKKFVLSTDTPINRILVGALRKLAKVDDYRQRALYLLDFFRDVTNPIEQNGDMAFKSIIFNSNNEYYRRTLSLAAMIIDNYEYEDFGYDKGTDSFLLNFDALYEDFVIKVLTESSINTEFSTWNRMQTFATVKGTNQSIVYQPDILFKYKKEDPENDFKPSAFAILDCKNKAHHVFKNADVYQVISYSRKLNAKKTLLLYPSFMPRQSEQLLLDNELFSPSEIYAAFVNIGDIDQNSFLHSIELFRDEVLRIINF
jgi:5-methylcytosine-specific restriction enzyme subunit McrC